jgi:hypothetical protein
MQTGVPLAYEQALGEHRLEYLEFSTSADDLRDVAHPRSTA